MVDTSFAFSSGIAALVAPCSAVLIASYGAFVANRKDKVKGFPLGQLLKSTLKLIAGFGIIVVLTFLLIRVNRMAFLVFEILAVVVGILLILWGVRTAMNFKRFRTLRYLEFPSIFGIIYGIVAVSCMVPLFLYMDGTLIEEGLVGIISFILIFLIGSSIFLLALVFIGQLFRNVVQRIFREHNSYLRFAAALVVILSGLFIINFELTVNGLLHLIVGG